MDYSTGGALEIGIQIFKIWKWVPHILHKAHFSTDLKIKCKSQNFNVFDFYMQK